MHVLGFSVPVIVLLLIAFIVGGKYPGVVAKIPFVGGM